MTPQAAKTLFEDFSHDELQAIKEACCEICKGDIGFWDSDCRFSCKAFIDEALEYIATDGLLNPKHR